MRDDPLWKLFAAVSVIAALYFFGSALLARARSYDVTRQAALDGIVSGVVWLAAALVPFFSEPAREWPPISLCLNSIAAVATSGAAILMFPAEALI